MHSGRRIQFRRMLPANTRYSSRFADEQLFIALVLENTFHLPSKVKPVEKGYTAPWDDDGATRTVFSAIQRT